MADFTRAKRISDSFNDQARARLVCRHLCCVSSGSDHSSEPSPCLSELVHGFLEDDSDNLSVENESDSERAQPNTGSTDNSIDIINKANARIREESYRNILSDHVSTAFNNFSGSGLNKSSLRRKVMSFLRELGYNAAICKTKWESSGGITAGNYEFIDVVQAQCRYFVDLDFAGEFEIARPTNQYGRLVECLSPVFVGKSEELKRIVRVMSDSAKLSLKTRELTVSPWRKNRYMQNKWFGPYRRTTNPSPVNLLPATMSPSPAINCRFVGFDDVQGRLFVRTR